VSIRETDKLSGAFVEARDVAAVTDGMETWSRLVFTFLVGESMSDPSVLAVPVTGS
jgi:hypothetical protein